MKKTSRHSTTTRPIPRSSSLDNLGMDNKKLEEDIVLMENTIQHHRNKMIQQDLAVRTQIRKATGSSRWISGGKGQLTGYKSHKDLHPGDRQGSTRPGPKKGQHTTQKVKNTKKAVNAASDSMSSEKGHAQHTGKHKRSNTAQGPIQQQGIEMDIHADEIHPTTRRRSSGSSHGILSNSSPEDKRNKKQGHVRKVSFELSDEDDDDGVAGTSYTGHGKDNMNLNLYNLDQEKDFLNANRIAGLKAKVIAKANASITPDCEKPKVTPDSGTSKVKTHKGLQPKKTKKVQTAKKEEKKSTGSIVKNTTSQKPPELSATGSEVQRVQKGNTKPPEEIVTVEKPEHSYIKWGGYESDPDELDHKSSSHSSSDVFFVEPTVSYSKPDKYSLFSSRPVVEHDPAVTAWLYSLNLLDPEKYSQLFHAHNMTMESVLKLTENQLKAMGISSFPTSKKILDGIKELKGKEKTATTFEMTASLDNITGRRISAHTAHKDGKMPPVTPKHTLSNESVRASTAKSLSKTEKEVHSRKQIDLDFLVTGRSTDRSGVTSMKDSDAAKKKGAFLTTEVKKRTLASGLHAASSRLKNKQEQELEEQKRQEKMRRIKKAERDQMVKKHEQRLKERAERMRREEEEGIVGYDDDDETSDSTSPQASQTVCVELKDLEVLTQGLQLGGRQSSHSGSGRTSKREPVNYSTKETTDSLGDRDILSPEENLQDLELQVSGLQAASNPSSSETEAKLERIHQQLAALQQQLRPKTAAVHQQKSVEDIRKKRAVSAPMGKGHRRHRTKSMSKEDLLKEVKKQKDKHKKEIKLLESELGRLRYRDPVKGCELPEEDVVFDETVVLGEGTFSQVFSGNFNGSEVAIKRLKIPIQEADHNYFAEEVTLLHELRHPRVVLLLGVCTTGRLPLMVLEYMAGGSLYHYLHNGNRPSLDHVGYFQIARDICLGMNYLHRHRPVVLHLDLKSMNVLLGAYGRAKIADFGFSKLRHEAGSGKVRGTPAWMAPELLENVAELTTKVDVYSFAIILWEMLTRDTPYEGLSVFQVLERVKRNKRLEIPTTCPEPLRRLICACWEHKPSKRPSFKEILISLEGLSFPPEWKALLSAAGIPRETLEDPTSARDIISLVNQSMTMSQRDLDHMALESHMQFMKAMDITEEDVEETNDHHNNQEAVLNSVEDAINVPHITMEDSGYDEESGQQLIPQAPPPPLIVPPSTYLTPASVMAQAQVLRKTRQHGRIHSPDRGAPEFQLDGRLLTNQREKLRGTTHGPHPSQLADLEVASDTRLTSIAELLRKAVNSRRTALKEDLQSKEFVPDSVWSMDSPQGEEC